MTIASYHPYSLCKQGQLEQEEPPEGGVDKNHMESLRLSLTSLSEMESDESDPLKTNRALCQLLEQERELETPIGIEEVSIFRNPWDGLY